MKVVVQRVSSAKLTVDGETAGSIGRGLVVLAGFRDQDSDAEPEWMAQKVLGLRVFPDEEGNLNRSLQEIGGQLMVVPNFTLYADCRKGRRPSFSAAAAPQTASPLYDRFVEQLAANGAELVSGRFGSHMYVDLVNDGPVTLIIERETV
jgi:D-tyrosyl-tRNA(Tyr) deacylase